MLSGKTERLVWKLSARDSNSRRLIGIFIFVCVVGVGSTARHVTETRVAYACFNTIFESSCQPNEVLLFESARYGRNDSLGSVKCDMPFTRSCDVDVQYPLSRACGGRRKCSIAVNTAFFGDPCGYEEFLKVTYKCLPNSAIHRHCEEPTTYRFLDSGYLASPNYPGKYYPDGDCHWSLAVQPQQILRLTLYDFELDVKRGGTCHDFLDVTSGNRTHFRDCGTLGKQVIEVDSNRVLIWFRTGQTSLTQRGFIIHIEAVGRGCELIHDLLGPNSESVHVVYQLEGEVLVANVTCEASHEFADGDPVTTRVLRCQNDSWSTDLPRCLPSVTVTTSNGISIYNSTSPTDEFPVTIFIIVIGVVSSVLLLLLILVVCAVRCNRRRRFAEVKRDEWRVVVNNLQDNVINDVTKALHMRDDFDEFLQFPAKPSHACAKRHNTKRCADAWPNRNLLFASRDVYVEADDRTTQQTTASEAGISGPFVRCALCWAEEEETSDVGGYVGFATPSPSPRDDAIGLGRRGVETRTRTPSEPLIGVCLDTRSTSVWYSAPELSSSKSAT